MPFRRVAVVAVLLFTLVAFVAEARIISYSPYTDRAAIPAVQSRTNHYFVLLETGNSPTWPSPILSPMPPYSGGFFGQVVLYDSSGNTEPRVVFPSDGSEAYINSVAVYESFFPTTPAPGTGVYVPFLLIQTTSKLDGTNPDQKPVWIMSNDGGHAWIVVQLPTETLWPASVADVGGPFVRGRQAQVRIGSHAYPFAVTLSSGTYLVGANGSVQQLRGPGSSVIGTSPEPVRFLVREGSSLLIASPDGTTQAIGTITPDNSLQGWITPTGAAYVEESGGAEVALTLYRAGTATRIASGQRSYSSTQFFAIPTFDYSGAWMIERGGSKPTVLSSHSEATGLVKHWEDVAAPEVEALHAGSSGTKLLIQVHRSRPQPDQRMFVDPALAVWRVGQPAPRSYDELFLNEQPTKGFVHLDVERAETGEPFVFDSGVQGYFDGGAVSPSVPPASGGGDVIQEWGVVRASLKQQLVVPSVGRTEGAYGSFWKTDLVVHNPDSATQTVTLRFVPSGEVTTADLKEKTITLEKGEIRLIPDMLKSLFGYESGLGALYVMPQAGVNVTSRTYNTTDKGSFGYAMNAIDVYAGAASPRFPVTFAGAFPGSNFRTNLVIADTSGRGTDAALNVSGPNGPTGLTNVTYTAGPNGHQQANSIGTSLGLLPFENGALVFRPTRGSAIAAVMSIDNRTNDSTYFAPDLPAAMVRTIPAIGHLEGAFNSSFRSDLFLYNPAAQPRAIQMQATMWDQPSTVSNLNLTLLPGEGRMIKDVLSTAFGRKGIARLRYQTTMDGVRVTSRTYSVDENGGTYGFVMPPLNNFQSGSSGDTLEILGAVASEGFRTNLALVELNAFASPMTTASARVEIVDSAGTTVDSFVVEIATASGYQINDLFGSRSLNVKGPVLIRVSPIRGMISAYATTTDNGTNDSILLSANLGTH